MPPEAKPVISFLEEIICSNCIYSMPINRDNRISCHKDRADAWDIYDKDDFCSNGKWLCNDSIYVSVIECETRPWVTDYDDCYQIFGRKSD